MNLSDPENRDLASAEYVIGLMETDNQEVFEQSLLADADLVELVAWWRTQLNGLNARLAPIEPSASLWLRIESALFAQVAAPPVLRDHVISPRPSLWNSLALWRTISALAVAGSIAMFTLITVSKPEVQVYVAVLKSPEQSTGWLLQAREQGAVRLIPLNPQDQVAEDKTLQLWTQPAGATTPIPIALIEAGASIELTADQLPGLGVAQLFAISLEPAGGSPTGLPTGPILFAGNTERI